MLECRRRSDARSDERRVGASIARKKKLVHCPEKSRRWKCYRGSELRILLRNGPQKRLPNKATDKAWRPAFLARRPRPRPTLAPAGAHNDMSHARNSPPATRLPRESSVPDRFVDWSHTLHMRLRPRLHMAARPLGRRARPIEIDGTCHCTSNRDTRAPSASLGGGSVPLGPTFSSPQAEPPEIGPKHVRGLSSKH